MSRGERWLLDVANAVVGGTGIVYAIMRYLMEPSDEWAVVNHPWQPHVQHLHILVAPLLVFASALIWKGHVGERLRATGSQGRATGLALASQLAPMVLSGYLIQVSVEQTWRTTWIWIHVVTAGLWLAGSVLHRVTRI